jgi:fructoselysine 6-kinase
MTRILGLGDNTVDIYVEARVQYPGGNAANVAALASRLGAAAGYLGCVGEDDAGELVRTALGIEGVDISRIRVRPGPNARTLIGHIAEERRFIQSDPGVRADYRFEPDDFSYIAGFDHVHTSIYSDLGEALPQIAASARSLSIDASDGWDKDYLRQVLPHVRFAFLSAESLNGGEALAVAQFCLALGPEAVVLTRGEGGALGVSAKGPIYQPALPTYLVDTLGAGDGFIAGFLMGALTGGGLKAGMSRGAHVASLVCGWHGAFGHAARWAGDPNEIRGRSGY